MYIGAEVRDLTSCPQIYVQYLKINLSYLQNLNFIVIIFIKFYTNLINIEEKVKYIRKQAKPSDNATQGIKT